VPNVTTISAFSHTFFDPHLIRVIWMILN